MVSQVATREVLRSPLRRLMCSAQDHFNFCTLLIISDFNLFSPSPRCGSVLSLQNLVETICQTGCSNQYFEGKSNIDVLTYFTCNIFFYNKTPTQTVYIRLNFFYCILYSQLRVHHFLAATSSSLAKFLRISARLSACRSSRRLRASLTL